MRLLLDTHTFIWWLEDRGLSPAAREAVMTPTNSVYVSMVSAYEISLKVTIGKLPGCAALLPRFSETLLKAGFHHLEATVRHGLEAGRLPRHHRDPWDRVLAAQALGEDMSLVSNDAVFDAYGVTRVW
jgi:PIN domain nuclease of toxin-antitoxin system